MIKLTKLNDEKVVVNSNNIQTIEMIPESKLIFVNKDHLIVKETIDQIIEMVIDFNAKIYNLHQKLIVIHEDDEEEEMF